MTVRSHRCCFCLLLVLAMLTSGGCAAYRFGSRSLFRPDIATVHVPVFESESLRRGLGERLTEAVVKEIESRTPYKVVHSPQADSTLRGRVAAMAKNVLVENVNDEPRALEVSFQVQISWLDRQGNLITGPVNVPLEPLLLNVNQATSFVPEAGQSMATAQQEAINRLARQIVSQMEMAW